VHPWQVAVEDHDVVGGDGQPVERVGPVEGDVDRHPLPPEPHTDGAGEHRVVLDDEHSHPTMIPAPG
jgi:hypothetical protein